MGPETRTVGALRERPVERAADDGAATFRDDPPPPGAKT